ncbi:MAG: ion transporter [Alphaproteobacteria bacterium]|nr:MAG: ion transporter [Alphaproteobacteria bacterium]
MNESDTAQLKRDGADDGEPSSRPATTALVPLGEVAAAPLALQQRQGWLARLFGLRKRPGTSLRDDLADALSADATALHSFSAEEKLMLTNILRLQDVRVEDLMVPRADIEAVEIDTPLGELLKIFEESGHSRMPVYGETLDDPRGMVHIRDIVAHITKTAGQTKAAAAARRKPAAAALDLKKVGLDRPLGALKIIRKVLFVPPSMLAVNLLARMQASRTQMALVIDEYGGTDGLVSLEDIVEMVVGDIEDEHDDEDEPMIVDKGDGTFIVDAKAELDDVAAAVGSDFQVGEHSEDVDTVGGLIFALTGRVPVRGEIIEGLGYEFRVLDADPRRIKRIELAPSKRRRLRKNAAA